MRWRGCQVGVSESGDLSLSPLKEHMSLLTSKFSETTTARLMSFCSPEHGQALKGLEADASEDC